MLDTNLDNSEPTQGTSSMAMVIGKLGEFSSSVVRNS